MRPLFSFLLGSFLAAQGRPGVLDQVPDLGGELGVDPALQIRLAPPGCWDGLLLGLARPPLAQARRSPAGATVEVWDLAYRVTSRQEAFGLHLESLRRRLSRALETPPPSHGKIELSELVFSDPSNPQKLDLTKVKSMQDRFNRLPPNGSPVR